MIINELYALATDDGYTKIQHNGVRVFDQNLSERVILGWWLDGWIKRFGLKIFAADGNTVILDDRGILQTWQEGRADNVDENSPLILNIYLPPEARSVRQAILRFRIQNFRAYEKAAADGGETDATSAAGGGDVVTSTSDPEKHVSTSAGGEGIYTSDKMHMSNTPGDWTGYNGLHNHGIPDNTPLSKAGGGLVVWHESGEHNHVIYRHSHDVYIPLHNHEVIILGHNHEITIPEHEHEVSVPAHTHDLDFGIYTSTSAANVTVRINGKDRTTVLGGPFNSSQSHINIAPYLNAGQWNTIELGSSRLGRIDATIFIQAMMGV